MKVYNPHNLTEWIDLPISIEENYKLVMAKYSTEKNDGELQEVKNDDKENKSQCD